MCGALSRKKSFNKIDLPWQGVIKLGFQVQFLEQYRCALTDGYRRDNTLYGKFSYNYIVESS